MTIEIIEPLQRGWDRMKKALFRPFDLRKWFLVGFTAFLAGLTESHGGGQSKWTKRLEGHRWEDLFRFPSEAREWLASHPLWAGLIMAALFIAVGLAVVFTWLSSRGNFMFLDNVARDRSRISEPWHEYRSLGNSLFAWRLGIGVAAFIVFSGYILYCFLALSNAYEGGRPGEAIIIELVVMGLGLIGLGLVSGIISLFLNDFVSAVMYKRGLDAGPSIRVFLDLFRERPLPLLAYGLTVFVLKIAVVFLVVIVGLVTCCAGFLLLAVPYVNAVILLPVSYTFRAFSLEFIAQFGSGFNCLTAGRQAKPRVIAGKPRAKK
jgi:hypothetical protein